MRRFTEEVRRTGVVAEIASRAGMRGIVKE
jgi:hypothetical protein